jgi:hypothetical protein
MPVEMSGFAEKWVAQVGLNAHEIAGDIPIIVISTNGLWRVHPCPVLSNL